MTVHARFKDERERLSLSQSKLAEQIGVGKTTVINWEKGASAPDALQLAAFAATGADLLYVLLGERGPVSTLNEAEEALIDSYRRCKPAARVNLIQTAALLSAGLGAPGTKKPSTGSVQIGNITQRSDHDGSVQVGYAGGNVRVKK